VWPLWKRVERYGRYSLRKNVISARDNILRKKFNKKFASEESFLSTQRNRRDLVVAVKRRAVVLWFINKGGKIIRILILCTQLYRVLGARLPIAVFFFQTTWNLLFTRKIKTEKMHSRRVKLTRSSRRNTKKEFVYPLREIINK